jgi:hypothetical protein
VLRVGNQSPEELLAALARYIPHETDGGLREMAPAYLGTLAMLQHLGLAGPEGRVEVTLAKPDGLPFTSTVTVADPRVTQLSIAEAMHLPAPLFRSQTQPVLLVSILGRLPNLLHPIQSLPRRSKAAIRGVRP